NQKVVEEAPSPFLDEATRKAMGEQAVALAKAVGYTSAGTVEFIVDGNRNFYFLEMNTRLQVEHPVTELITGVDLVEQMIRVANGEKLPFAQDDLKINGWAIENRLYAEDPYRGFLPSIGRLTRYRPPVEGPTETGGIVRNDTGVFEGGEISMYYDPMIAKLCTWAPTRAQAIEEMRVALDTFEVEGIGHNLPFVAAVMDHERFTSGNMTTAFIAEEYPDGFEGVTLPDAALTRVAAAAAAMYRVAEIRRARVSGRMGNHERHVGTDWVVSMQGQDFPVVIKADKAGSDVTIGGETLRVESDWTPGDSLARLRVGGTMLVLKVGKATQGFRIRFRGADLRVHVRTPRQAELAKLMPEKVAPDTSKFLLCPMPGLVVKINVAVGDEVQEGQALATVEAMKMENILRAERKGTVKAIKAAEGDSLAVDEVIMEFE
ncbi:MAG: acetyl/propionyl-CoA carboxylase subunit alpha, partial [Rhodobacteraceae bacterium]|nr:acetyl/propionyl-CoA carboxylase subunit alpha [Paracoccaceae bacterium]